MPEAHSSRSFADGPILVVLAAGFGRRFGGDKQISALGPDGEWLFEYSIHDALAAGFTRIVLVIRETLRDALSRRLMPHIAGRAELVFVEQGTDSVPNGCAVPTDRHRPLGTAHALWCARAALDRPFAVVNADDYYGAAAFELLAGHFAHAPDPAMVGYRLDRTLSAHGGVNRGVCAVREDGHLSGIAEYTDIEEGASGPSGLDPFRVRQVLSAGAIVSLNCWGLLPDLLPTLEDGLRDFLSRAGTDDEYFLPIAIDRYLARGDRRLRVLRSDDDWLGVTYTADGEEVAARLAALHARGVYKTHLWDRE